MKSRAPNAVIELLRMNIEDRLSCDGGSMTAAEFKSHIESAVCDVVKDGITVRKTGSHTFTVRVPADLLEFVLRTR